MTHSFAVSDIECPYCGRTMALRLFNGFFSFRCQECGATSPECKTIEEAYAAAMKRERPKGEWHKFDANDFDTYPQAYKPKLLFHRDGYVEEGEWLGAIERWWQYHPHDVLKPDEVLYWCDLPEPPMEWMLENCCCFKEEDDE